MSTELQNEIWELIKPWKHSSDKPPFSYEELVVMVLLLNDAPLTGLRVYELILRWFGYYNKLACHMMTVHEVHPMSRVFKSRNPRPDALNMKLGVRHVFHRFEVPLKLVSVGKGSSVVLEDTHLLSKYTVAASAGRAFLQHLFASPCGADGKAGSSNTPAFFRLPPELRNCIYSLVLLYPESGISIELKRPMMMSNGFFRSDTALQVFTRGMNEPFKSLPTTAGDHYPGAVKPILDCHSPKDILALLLVNKQISSEATPVFYGGNSFVLRHAGDLHRLSQRTSESRWGMIQHVYFNYKPEQQSVGPKAFKALKKIPHLRELDIWVYKDDWIKEEPGAEGSKGPRSLLKIPGISTLQSVTVSTAVRFHGDCDELQQLIPKMVKKVEDKKVTAPRKRKSKAKTTGEEAATSTKVEEVGEAAGA